MNNGYILDIVDKNLNGVLPYSVFQGTKNFTLQLSIRKEGDLITDFIPTTITPYLVVYDRLDSLSTAYQLEDNLGIVPNTQNGIILTISSNELRDIVKYPNKCGLILNLSDGNGNSIITTEFNYNVIPNNAYDFIYGFTSN